MTIFSKNQITLAELDKLARDHNLMRDDAITRINEWAIDKFESPIIEENDNEDILYIRRDLIGK